MFSYGYSGVAVAFTEMLQAECEVFHSRPIAPTRRIALGRCTLPCNPAPGPGGILLGAIAARFVGGVDPTLLPDLYSLLHDLESGHRVPQPCLRHRFQKDRIGLTRSTHRLFRDGSSGELRVRFSEGRGSGTQHVLGALYATVGLAPEVRNDVLRTVGRGLMWVGDIGPGLFAYLNDAGSSSMLPTNATGDPVGWAMDILGLSTADAHPERSLVQRRFRDALLDAHPDHGGDDTDAARRIADLTEARRILMTA